MKTEELLEDIKAYTAAETVHMYIIERKNKPEAKAKDKPSVKFEYLPLQVNLSPDLMAIVKKMLSGLVEKKLSREMEIMDYEVIDDTIDKLYTYTDLGKIAGFQDFLANKLNKEIRQLKSFDELKDLEKSWALCYGFFSKDKNKWLYCIKKLSPRKIALDSNLSTNIKDAVKNGINSLFDLDTQMLKPFNGFSLNIEPSIDMLYVDEAIYIFQKKAFEDITSLTEEFEHLAKELVAEIEKIEFATGTQFLQQVIAEKPAFRNKLIKAKSIGSLDFLKTCGNVKKEFQRVGKKLDIKFNFDKDGKVIAVSLEEAENIIKVLAEYYKEGILGGKVFESPAGRIRK